MKLCEECTEFTIICDFCIHSREATVEETEELLWCEKHNKGIDVTEFCDDFYCSRLKKERND